MDWLQNTALAPQTRPAAAPGVQGPATMGGPSGWANRAAQAPPRNRMTQAAPAAAGAPAPMAGPPGYLRNNPGQLPPGWLNRMSNAPAAAPVAAPGAAPVAAPGFDLRARLAARLPPGFADGAGPAPVVADVPQSPMAAAIAAVRARGLGNDPRGALSALGDVFRGNAGPPMAAAPVQLPAGWSLPSGLAALPPGWGNGIGSPP